MPAVKNVELSCEIRKETEYAYLVTTDMGEAWVPKSQVSDCCVENDGTISSIFIPQWLAEEKGLV